MIFFCPQMVDTPHSIPLPYEVYDVLKTRTSRSVQQDDHQLQILEVSSHRSSLS